VVVVAGGWVVVGAVVGGGCVVGVPPPPPPPPEGRAVVGGGAGGPVVAGGGSYVIVSVIDDSPLVSFDVTTTVFGPGFKLTLNTHWPSVPTVADAPAADTVAPGFATPLSVTNGVVTWAPLARDTMLNGESASAVVLVDEPSMGTVDTGPADTTSEPEWFGFVRIRTPNTAATSARPARPIRYNHSW
jgi:hypothetical protein